MTFSRRARASARARRRSSPRHEGGQVAGHGVDVLDPVVHEEHLAAAAEFAHDGVADDVLVVAGHVGADGEAVHGRRLDHAELADAVRTSAACADRDVAVRVRTSISLRILDRSLWRTPKRCSCRSRAGRGALTPRRRCSRRCVPMTTSTVPARSPAGLARLLGSEEARRISTRIGYP